MPSRSAYPEQNNRDDPCVCHPPVSAGKTSSKAAVTETESAAPETSRQTDDDYVHIRVPRERMAPADDELTETVQHQVCQSEEATECSASSSLRSGAAADTCAEALM